ncbi:MAG: hypothetical protein JO127_04555 [Caulobacteraceae bacterium]|nr:hypothetical protein [Caulobacteraceae bacterium]
MIANLRRIGALSAALVFVAACVKIPTGPVGMGAPMGGAHGPYQLVLIPALGRDNAGFVRMNAATGQTMIAWGAPAQMVAVPDLPLPAGRYHMESWHEVSGDSVTWSAARIEENSGRVWVLTNCGASSCAWIELTPQTAR